MPSIHDYINTDTSQNKDLISCLKNAPQEIPDDPVKFYETTVKIALDNARRAGQTPNYQESFLAIEIDKKKSIVDGEGLIRLFVGYVVHPGDSGFVNRDLISIPRSDSRINRWNTILIDRFYITAPGYGSTFPANRGVVDDRPTRPTQEELFGEHYEEKVEAMLQELNEYATSLNKTSPNTNDLDYIRNNDKKNEYATSLNKTSSNTNDLDYIRNRDKKKEYATSLNKTSSNTIDLDYIRNRDKKLDSCMKSIRSMIDVVDEKLFKVKFNQFIGSLKISEKIKEVSNGNPEEVKKYYQALRMFYDKRMHKKKMENAVKYYDRDMQVFKSLHGIANKYNLAHKKWF